MERTIRGLLIVFASAMICTLSKGADALEMLTIPERQAESEVTRIDVPGGHSVVLNFRNGQYIQSVWVDDPALLAVITDRPLCGTGGGSGGGCGFASAIRLTGLSGALNLPGASFRSSGGLVTLVTINTTDELGGNRQVYQFSVVTNSAQSSPISLVNVTPGAGSDPRTSSLPSLSRLRPSTDLSDINLDRVMSGMSNAIAFNQADIESEAWRSLELFVSLSQEQGMSIGDAVSESGVPVALLEELQKMGADSNI